MVISFVDSGSFKNMEAFLNAMQKLNVGSILEGAAQDGVDALRSATPTESGLASSSWGYNIKTDGRGVTITWTNVDIESGFPVALSLQYGYSTGTGGYVAGRDYINPAMRPIFDSIADRVWKAVTSA